MDVISNKLVDIEAFDGMLKIIKTIKNNELRNRNEP